MPIYIMSSRRSLTIRHFTCLRLCLFWTLNRDANWQKSGSPRYSSNDANDKKRALEWPVFLEMSTSPTKDDMRLKSRAARAR